MSIYVSIYTQLVIIRDQLSCAHSDEENVYDALTIALDDLWNHMSHLERERCNEIAMSLGSFEDHG